MPFTNPVPSEWDVTYAPSSTGEPHRAIVMLSGKEMHRIDVPVISMSGRAALIELHMRAEAWIWKYLLDAGVM